jgi:hypothetical protein
MMNTVRRLIVAILSCIAASCGSKSKSQGELAFIDPNKILYSLPTICDSAPACNPSPPPTGAKALHEDDWRQIEFVASSNREYIEQELAKLAAFKEEHRRGLGFQEIYVRKEHPTPLGALSLTFANPPELQASALSLGSPPYGGTVTGGFALADTNGWQIYGQRAGGDKVIHLAIEPAATKPTTDFVNVISRIVNNNGLLLVDWYAAAVVDTSTPDAMTHWASRYQQDER